MIHHKIHHGRNSHAAKSKKNFFTWLKKTSQKNIAKIKLFSLISVFVIALTIISTIAISKISNNNQASALSVPILNTWKSDFNDKNWQIVGQQDKENLWHKTNGGFYFGNDAKQNYDTGKAVAGHIEYPFIDIPKDGNLSLQVDQKFQAELSSVYDKAQISIISSDNAVSKTYFLKNDLLNKDNSASTSSISSEKILFVPMDEFKGKKVTLLFGFDSVDGLYNNYFGWLIKSAQIINIPNSGPDPNPKTETVWTLGQSNWVFNNYDSSPNWPNYKPNLWSNYSFLPECKPNQPCLQGGSSGLYYGNSANNNYDTGRKYSHNYGFAIANDIVLPDVDGLKLNMEYLLDVENLAEKDIAKIQINGNSVWEKVVTGKKFEKVSIDIGNYKNQKIRIQLYFDTVDNIENSGIGWQIKTLSIDYSKFPNNPNPGDSNYPKNLWKDNGQGWNKVNSIQGVENLWNQTSSCLPTASNQDCQSDIFYSNSKNNYDNGQRNGGTITSPIIQIPKLTQNESLLLNFGEIIDVEPGTNWDKAKIFVNYTPDIKCSDITKSECSSANNKALIYEKDQTNKGFAPKSINVGNYSDQKIQFEFFFDTVDSYVNQTEGWRIKNLKLDIIQEFVFKPLINDVKGVKAYDNNGDLLEKYLYDLIVTRVSPNQINVKGKYLTFAGSNPELLYSPGNYITNDGKYTDKLIFKHNYGNSQGFSMVSGKYSDLVYKDIDTTITYVSNNLQGNLSIENYMNVEAGAGIGTVTLLNNQFSIQI